MDEIKRLQQLAGISEIKINNPNNSFQVTDYGRQIVEDITNIFKLAEKLNISELLHDQGSESEIFQYAHNLQIWSDTHGESMIKMSGNNTLEEYDSLYLSIWDDDVEQGRKVLKKYAELKFITDIKI